MSDRKTKPCMTCGNPVPIGYLQCGPCIRYDTARYLERQKALASK